MNTELIEQQFDDKDVANRPGSYGKLLTYISFPAYVKRMNDVFDYNWSCDVQTLEFREDEVIAVVQVTAEGISKTQAGGKRITTGRDGKVISLGDDTKAAITTAFKKCCQMFGIGIYLVGSDDEEGSDEKPQRTTSRTNATITEAQLNLIKGIRTEMGLSVEEVQAHCMDMFDLPVTNLNKTQASTFINALKIAKQNDGNGQPPEDERTF